MKDISKLTDEKIIKLTIQKDKELYAHLIRRYQDKLLRYAGYLVEDDHRAADIVQESFIKAYINLNGFDTKKKFSSWIYRIVHNEAMNSISKQKKHIPLYEDINFNSGIDLEEDLIRKELKIRTNSCLQQMQKIYSEPLALYFLEGKSYEEISDILRIPIGTVGTRINRAKVVMQKICQK